MYNIAVALTTANYNKTRVETVAEIIALWNEVSFLPRKV